jgi:hypothetical protein
MKQKVNMKNQFESTYALLVRSEDKNRSALETLLYAIFILSVLVGIWQFAQTPIRISAPGIEPCVACQTTDNGYNTAWPVDAGQG